MDKRQAACFWQRTCKDQKKIDAMESKWIKIGLIQGPPQFFDVKMGIFLWLTTFHRSNGSETI